MQISRKPASCYFSWGMFFLHGRWSARTLLGDTRSAGMSRLPFGLSILPSTSLCSPLPLIDPGHASYQHKPFTLPCPFLQTTNNRPDTTGARACSLTYRRPHCWRLPGPRTPGNVLALELPSLNARTPSGGSVSTRRTTRRGKRHVLNTRSICQGRGAGWTTSKEGTTEHEGISFLVNTTTSN